MLLLNVYRVLKEYKKTICYIATIINNIKSRVLKSLKWQKIILSIFIIFKKLILQKGWKE